MLRRYLRSQRRNLFKIIHRKFSTEGEISYDVCIVGGGIAGLSTAIKIKQLNKEINVVVLEKGSEIGSHIISGNCFEAKSLDKLFPNWETMKNPPPITQKVNKEYCRFMWNKNTSINIPMFLVPKKFKNDDNYIISLAELCAWLGEQAEELKIDIFTGFAIDDFLINENKEILGVKTKELGIDKNGEKTENYQESMFIKAPLTVLAEGARGSLSEKVIDLHKLRDKSAPPTYGIGIKELWEVPEEEFKEGIIEHSVGWPAPRDTYAGGFLYTQKPNYIHMGYTVGLDYKNPYLNPYEEFQQWKTQKSIRKYIKNGSCLKYGARVISAGGYFSLPKLYFPGGILVGCSAGFLNAHKIKGAHNALKSGVIAAETIVGKFQGKLEEGIKLKEYEDNIKESEINQELYQARNFKGAFKKGLFPGLINAFIDSWTKGRNFFNFKIKKKDSEYIEKAENHQKIDYPKHDGKLTFDLLENLSRSDTYHDHNQKSHLVIKKNQEYKWKESLKDYAGFEGLLIREILSC